MDITRADPIDVTRSDPIEVVALSRCVDINLSDAMMIFMRSTVRIDDDLLLELKERARKENISLTRLLNRTLRAGIQASHKPSPRKPRYREKTYLMGTPRVDLHKALALAAELEDEEIIRKMMLRK